jgi:copper(I)-binding protein
MRGSNVWLPAVLALAMAGNAALAREAVHGANGWIREAPPVAPVRAGYVDLVNAGPVAAVVTGADSAVFGAVEIHEMADGGDGTMRMRAVPRLTIPAGGRVELRPGGLHLMLFRPQQPLTPGQSVPVRLHTEAGGVVELALQVR